MLTGELRSKIDAVWNAFWAGGIANPIEVIEQITYLLFMRGLDDAHTLEENKANRLKKPMERRIFPEGKDKIGKGGGVAYEEMRWSRLKNKAPAEMYEIVAEHVFPFLRTMAEEGTAHATHMKGARFTIPKTILGFHSYYRIYGISNRRNRHSFYYRTIGLHYFIRSPSPCGIYVHPQFGRHCCACIVDGPDDIIGCISLHQELWKSQLNNCWLKRT